MDDDEEKAGDARRQGVALAREWVSLYLAIHAAEPGVREAFESALDGLADWISPEDDETPDPPKPWRREELN